MTESSATDTTETPIAFDRGMCSWMYCASSGGCMGSSWVTRLRPVRDSPQRYQAGSSKEAGIPVLPNQGDELLDRGNVRGGLVAVPLHVLAQPENAPPAHRAYVGRLGNGKLDSLTGCPTARLAHLKDLDALTRDPIREVGLLTKVVRRTTTFNEGTYRPAYARPLELRERHRQPHPQPPPRPRFHHRQSMETSYCPMLSVRLASPGALDDAQIAVGAVAERAQRLLVLGTVMRGDGLR